jgi:DNA replication protein DnaC
MPAKFKNARLDNYHPHHAKQQNALDKSIAFAKQDISLIVEGKTLFLYGPVGTGKTHLAVGTAYEIAAVNADKFGFKCRNTDFLTLEELEISRQFPGMTIGFVNVTDLLLTLLESFSGDKSANEKATQMLHRAKMDDLVILDEIGLMKPTEWVESQLYNLIDVRYRMERPMIFTSNYTPKELEKQVGKRVVSRIIEISDGVHVDGPDYRKRKLAAV